MAEILMQRNFAEPDGGNTRRPTYVVRSCSAAVGVSDIFGCPPQIDRNEKPLMYVVHVAEPFLPLLHSTDLLVDIYCVLCIND